MYFCVRKRERESVCACVCACDLLCINVCVWYFVYVCVLCVCVCLLLCVCVCVIMCMHTCVCLYIYIYIYIYYVCMCICAAFISNSQLQPLRWMLRHLHQRHRWQGGGNHSRQLHLLRESRLHPASRRHCCPYCGLCKRVISGQFRGKTGGQTSCRQYPHFCVCVVETLPTACRLYPQFFFVCVCVVTTFQTSCRQYP